MSWNLTKSKSLPRPHPTLRYSETDKSAFHLTEFKDTHLGPLKNPLSGRSTSTSTLKGSDAATESTASTTPRVSTPTQENPNPLAAPPNGSASTPAAQLSADALVSQPPGPVKPGILIVTLHEGKGLSLPPQHHNIFTPAAAAGPAAASYAGSIRPSTSSSRMPNVAGGQVAGSFARPQSTGGPGGAGGGINAAPTNHGRYSSRYLPYALLDFDKLQIFVDAVSGSPECPLWAGSSTQYKFDVSRTTELSLQLYLRNPNARPGAGRSDDIFLGACKVKPKFEEVPGWTDDGKLSRKEKEKKEAERSRETGQAGDDWLKLTFGTGALKIGVRFVENRERALTIEDFELLKVVGKGSFGKVMQVM